MSRYSTGFVISGPIVTDECVTLALGRMREMFRGATVLLERATGHKQRYIRALLNCEKAISLQFFVTSLAIVQRLGDRKARGLGREWVAAILGAIAAPFGLKVVPDEERAVSDVETEIRELNSASHRACAPLGRGL